jgi:8-oxo-dGTP diphosphatase
MKKTAEGKYLKDNLANYSSEKYSKPSVTVDIAICSIIDSQLKVLLIQRKYPPFRGLYALPGGFVELSRKESLEETAKRELQEETGLKDIYFEQLKTYGDVDRDPRMRIITVAYFALVPYDQVCQVKAGDDATDCVWFPLRNLPQLAFDHNQILSDLLQRLVGKISYSEIAFSLVPKVFSWSAVQHVFEAVLGEKLLAPNFRRFIKAHYKIKELKSQQHFKSLGRKSNSLSYWGTKDKLLIR